MTAESIQTVLAALTIVAVVVFLALYLRPSERWWKTAFGWSLALMAFSIGLTCMATVLYRLNGGPYPGRSVMLLAAGLTTLVAMVMRVGVLWRAQHSDRHLTPQES